MRSVTLTPPNASMFAGVQVDVPDPEGRDGRRIVGAAPAFRMEGDRMVPLERVSVDCHLGPDDAELRAVWAYEDSTLPNEQTSVSLDQPAGRVVGGLRVS